MISLIRILDMLAYILWDCKSRSWSSALQPKLVNVAVTSCCSISWRCKIITHLRSSWLLPAVPWFSAIAVSHVTAVKISVYCVYFQHLNGSWCSTIQERRAVAQKPRDAVVKFDTFRNVQRHRAVIPAIAWLLFWETITASHVCRCSNNQNARLIIALTVHI